jgi:hypothetical protein
MAQIPRNVPPIISTTVSSGRLQGGLHTVSSSDASPVEETGSIGQDSVLFNDALLYQQEDQTKHGQGKGREASVSIEYAGSSQMFANIFEDVDHRNGEVQTARSKGFANLVARAIDVYETNIQLIKGTATPRGTNLSLRL